MSLGLSFISDALSTCSILHDYLLYVNTFLLFYQFIFCTFKFFIEFLSTYGLFCDFTYFTIYNFNKISFFVPLSLYILNKKLSYRITQVYLFHKHYSLQIFHRVYRYPQIYIEHWVTNRGSLVLYWHYKNSSPSKSLYLLQALDLGFYPYLLIL